MWSIWYHIIYIRPITFLSCNTSYIHWLIGRYILCVLLAIRLIGCCRNQEPVCYRCLNNNFQYLNNIIYIFTRFLFIYIFKKYKQHYKNNITKRIPNKTSKTAYFSCSVWSPVLILHSVTPRKNYLSQLFIYF